MYTCTYAFIIYTYLYIYTLYILNKNFKPIQSREKTVIYLFHGSINYL